VAAKETTDVDGREQRSRKTKASIVEAWLELVEGGTIAPTARETADHAGIGLRTVFQHFADLDDLHATAAAMHFDRIGDLLAPIETSGGFDDRLARVVAHRANLFERITPVRRAALHRAQGLSGVESIVHAADQRFTDQALLPFAAEFAELGEGRSRIIRVALDAAWSWYAWDYLRTGANRTVGECVEAFVVLGRGVFAVQRLAPHALA
jgi:TetR/AcrR family transcriptional regulator, regulator of autoinduction and epiphytic fitness